jgi:hypothetical protein
MRDRWAVTDIAVAQRRNWRIAFSQRHNGGTQLPSREADGSFNDFRPLIAQRGFRLAHRAPKYRDESLHPFGINTFYYLFERN